MRSFPSDYNANKLEPPFACNLFLYTVSFRHTFSTFQERGIEQRSMPDVLCVPCLLCTVLSLLYTVPCARYTQCRARCTHTGPCLWHTHSSVPLADTLSVPVILCSVHGVQCSLYVIDTLLYTRYTLFFTQWTPFRACADCSVLVIHSSVHNASCSVLVGHFSVPDMLCSEPDVLCSVPDMLCSVPVGHCSMSWSNEHAHCTYGWLGREGGRGV